MKTFGLLIILLAGLITASCDSKNDSNVTDRSEGNLSKLITKIETTQLQMQQENILTVMTNADQEAMNETLGNIKVALLRLNKNEQDEDALRVLVIEIGELKKIPLSQRDQAGLALIIDELSQQAKRIMDLQGLDYGLDNLESIVYEYRFSKGLEYFNSYGRSAVWTPGWSLDRPHVRINGGRNFGKSWLITPLLDLTTVRNPSFRIYHSLMLNANDRSTIPFERNRVINSVFRAYVSTNYNLYIEDEDPEESADWKEVQLTGFPLGRDFHSRWSDPISLKDYEGKVVSIAIVYNIEPRVIGTHFLMWQIQNFQVLGAASDFEFYQRPVPVEAEALYTNDFNLEISNYKQTAVEGEPAFFFSSSRNGQDYLEISAFSDKNTGVSLLETKEIDVPENTDSCLQLTQVINFYSQEAKDRDYLQVQVGVVGSDERTTIELKEVPNGDNWSPVTSECVSMDAYKNKKIKVYFRYQSNADDGIFPNWQLRKLELLSGVNK